MTNDRTIVPGVWSDVFAGLDEQGKGRLKLHIVDQYGDDIYVDNPLPVSESAVRVHDSLNSTSDILSAGQEWVGEWVPNLNSTTLVVDILTNVTSAEDGFKIQSSDDGVNVHHVHSFTISANEPEGMHVESAMTCKYYRLRYLNGGTAQTNFHIGATLSKSSAVVHSHSLNHEFDENHTVNLTRSVIAGFRPNGTPGNVRVSADDALFIHNDPHEYPETSWHMMRDTGVTDTLAVAAAKGDQAITVTNGAQWASGNKIKITDGDNTEYDHLTIKGAPAGNVLTLDRPLDSDHIVGTPITGSDVNLARDGSSTPLTYYYKPRVNQKVHIHGINITMSSSGEPALYKFAGGDPLTYGIHFKIKNETGRDYTTYRPFRLLNAFELSCWEYEKEDKVGTLWFVHLKTNLANNTNSIIYLDGSLGQQFVAIIRDDITTRAATFEVVLNLHEEKQ